VQGNRRTSGRAEDYAPSPYTRAALNASLNSFALGGCRLRGHTMCWKENMSGPFTAIRVIRCQEVKATACGTPPNKSLERTHER
jgi:hypothetical protein